MDPSEDILWNPMCLIFILIRTQAKQRRSIIYRSTCYLPHCVKSSRSVQELVENHRSTTCGPLPWRHLRQFMRGSLRGGASQTQQTSSTPAETEEQQRRTREEQGRERVVNRINLCILIHILATSLISVSPAPFLDFTSFDGWMFSQVLTGIQLPPLFDVGLSGRRCHMPPPDKFINIL